MRTNQFLRFFARDHAVTLLSFVANDHDRVLAERVSTYCEEIHLVSLPPWKSAVNVAINAWRDVPFQSLYYRSARMEQIIGRLLASRSFDMAYVHLLRMAPYFADYKQLYRVLDLTDLISYELESSLPHQTFPWNIIYAIETPRVAFDEKRLAAHFDEIWFISQRDRDMFAKSGESSHLHVVPHEFSQDLLLQPRTPGGESRLLFLGHLDVKHNIDAARFMAQQIMPAILREVPECKLQIVGAGGGKELSDLEDLPGVELIGFVHDLRTIFAKSCISVAPLRFSAGVQNKVIESMAAGLPVVATTGVSAGLSAKAERDLLEADSAEAFATQVIRLLRSERLREELGRNGREFVKTHFTSRSVEERLRAIENLRKRH